MDTCVHGSVSLSLFPWDLKKKKTCKESAFNSLSVLHRTEFVDQQWAGMVSQKTATDSRLSFRHSQALCCKVQHLCQHHACRIKYIVQWFYEAASKDACIGHFWSRFWVRFLLSRLGKVATTCSRRHNKHRAVWPCHSDDVRQFVEVCIQPRQQLSEVSVFSLVQLLVFLTKKFLSLLQVV